MIPHTLARLACAVLLLALAGGGPSSVTGDTVTIQATGAAHQGNEVGARPS